MANYTELSELKSDPAIGSKVETAIAIKCQAIIDDVEATTEEKTWAKAVIQDPKSKVNSIMWSLLVDNKDATIEQIQSASDASVQTNVNDAIDNLI